MRINYTTTDALAEIKRKLTNGFSLTSKESWILLLYLEKLEKEVINYGS